MNTVQCIHPPVCTDVCIYVAEKGCETHACSIILYAYCVYHIHTWGTQNTTHAQKDIDGVTFNIWSKTHIIQSKVCPAAMGGKGTN